MDPFDFKLSNFNGGKGLNFDKVFVPVVGFDFGFGGSTTSETVLVINFDCVDGSVWYC